LIGDEAHSNSNEKKSEKEAKWQMNAPVMCTKFKHILYKNDIHTKPWLVTRKIPIHQNYGSQHLAREDPCTTNDGIADGKDLSVRLP
jgi:hypothetical protein